MIDNELMNNFIIFIDQINRIDEEWHSILNLIILNNN